MIYKILILTFLINLFISCGQVSSKEKLESLTVIKQRLWEDTPLDKATELKTFLNLDLRKDVPIHRPISFLNSNDGNIYLVENNEGKLFKISADFQSVKEIITNKLKSPGAIREFNNNLFLLDNNGLNVFDKEGKLIKTINPHLFIEDFFVQSDEKYFVSLAELRLENDTKLVSILNSTGKRVESICDPNPVEYKVFEHKTFIEIKDDKLYLAYKFVPLVEVYDLKTGTKIYSFNIDASIFPPLMDLKKDKGFVNPVPNTFRIPKFIAGLKVAQDKIYVLLHTPNPVIVEFTLNGKEVQRYISKSSQAMDYFGFDFRLNNDTKQFFVGLIDKFDKPSLLVYEE
jgi:hypothetical protein